MNKEQRVIDKLRESLNLPETVSDSEIMKLKGSLTWISVEFGFALSELGHALYDMFRLEQVIRWLSRIVNRKHS